LLISYKVYISSIIKENYVNTKADNIVRNDIQRTAAFGQKRPVKLTP